MIKKCDYWHIFFQMGWLKLNDRLVGFNMVSYISGGRGFLHRNHQWGERSGPVWLDSGHWTDMDRWKSGMGVLFFPGQSGNLGFLVISLVQKQIFKKHTFWQLYTWNDYFLKDVFVLYTVCKRELIAQINQRTSYISKGWNHGGDLKNMYQVPCEDTAGLSSFPNIMFQDDRGVHHTIVHLMLMQPPPSVVLVCSDLETYSRPSVVKKN